MKGRHRNAGYLAALDMLELRLKTTPDEVTEEDLLEWMAPGIFTGVRAKRPDVALRALGIQRAGLALRTDATHAEMMALLGVEKDLTRKHIKDGKTTD